MALSLILPQQLENNYLLKGTQTQTAGDLFNYSILSSSTTSYENYDKQFQNDDYSDSSDEVILFGSSCERKKRIALPKAILAMWPCLIKLGMAALQYNIILMPIIFNMVLDKQSSISPREIIKQLILSSIKASMKKSSSNRRSRYDSSQTYLNDERETISNNRNSFFSIPYNLWPQGGENKTDYFIAPSASELEEDNEFDTRGTSKAGESDFLPIEEEGEDDLTAEGDGSQPYQRPSKYNPEVVAPNNKNEEGYHPNNVLEPGHPHYYYDQIEGEIGSERLSERKTSQYGEPDEYREYSDNKSTFFAIQYNDNMPLEGVCHSKCVNSQS